MKKSHVILLALLLILSIVLNCFLYFRLNKAYERIDKYLTSSYVKVNSAMETIESSLNDDMTFEEFDNLCKETVGLKKDDSIYNCGMQTNVFKWFDEKYFVMSLDTLALYVSCMWENTPQNYKENYVTLKEICSMWNESGIEEILEANGDRYCFREDPENLKAVVASINKQCNLYMDDLLSVE